MDEQSDDEFWDEFERILQGGYKEEAPEDKASTDELSTVDIIKGRFEEVKLEYKMPVARDPVWEASFQKQLNDIPKHIMDYLKDLIQKQPGSQPFGTQSVKQSGKSRCSERYRLLHGNSCKGKSKSLGMYQYYYPHLITSVGCFVSSKGDYTRSQARDSNKNKRFPGGNPFIFSFICF